MKNNSKALWISLFLVGCLVGLAVADSVVVTVTGGTATVGTATSYSDPINASGWLDRIELVRTDHATGTNQNTTAIVATYSGTTALTTFGTVTFAAGETTKTIRPRLIGTANSGTALAYAQATMTTDSNVVTQILVAPYERAMIGGNLKMAVAGDATNSTVTATLFFERTAK